NRIETIKEPSSSESSTPAVTSVSEPIEKVNAPDMGWPSSEVTRHPTKCVPSSRSSVGVITSDLSAAATSTGIFSPSALRSEVPSSEGVTDSLKVTEISCGASSTTEPSSGDVERTTACAAAGPAVATRATTNPAIARNTAAVGLNKVLEKAIFLPSTIQPTFWLNRGGLKHPHLVQHR